jgi:hypothetical protein
VEKVSEFFEATIAEWFKKRSPGREKRLSFLCEQLEASFPTDKSLPHQLFQKTASAIIEALKQKASDAAMVLVPIFSRTAEWFYHYAALLEIFGLSAGKNAISTKLLSSGIRPHLAWVNGSEKWLRIEPVNG